MISHLNYYAMVAVVDDLDDFTVEGDSMLLFLPLAHNFGRLMHLSGPYVGFTIAFCPDPLEVGRGAAHGRADRVPERARASTRRSTRWCWPSSKRRRASSGG